VPIQKVENVYYKLMVVGTLYKQTIIINLNPLRMIFSTDIKIIGTTPMCLYLYMKYFEYTKEKIVYLYELCTRKRRKI